MPEYGRSIKMAFYLPGTLTINPNEGGIGIFSCPFPRLIMSFRRPRKPIMLRILVLFLLIATPLWSQDLLVDSIDREFSGMLIKITDTNIHFQIQGEAEPVQYPFWSVKRVTLADGRLAFEDDNIYVAKPALTAEPKLAEPAPVVAEPMERPPMEARPEVESSTPPPAFVPETGRPLDETTDYPQPTIIPAEPDAGESATQWQVAVETFKSFQFLARQPFTVQFIGGLPIGDNGGAPNLALSYGFSNGIEIRGYRDIYESFYLYPTLTLGILSVNMDLLGSKNIGEEYFAYLQSKSTYESESLMYGIIEGHRQWGRENLRASGFLGVGLGNFKSYSVNYAGYEEREDYIIYIYDTSGDGGIGLVLSAGAQLESRRLMGGLRLYRTPGLGKFVTFANVGYQPKSFKELLAVAGATAAVVAAFIGVSIIIYL